MAGSRQEYPDISRRENNMENKKELHQQTLSGERSLFQGQDLRIYDTIFADGESPLKESRGIELYSSFFRWKYPLWYSRDILMQDCFLANTARAGIWYTDHLRAVSVSIEAPKTFRRCKDLTLEKVTMMSDAAETLWSCDGVKMRDVTAKGDYFAMNSRNMEIDSLELFGNYPFDGAENVVIRNSRLLSKDAFWNTNNVTVYDSYISGEYLGWNSKKLTLINCTIESLQGLCYAEELVLRNCRFLNTTLAFEYSTVDAEIVGRVDSVKNPTSGSITADSIGELILEKDKINPCKTRIVCREGGRTCACV